MPLEPVNQAALAELDVAMESVGHVDACEGGQLTLYELHRYPPMIYRNTGLLSTSHGPAKHSNSMLLIRIGWFRGNSWSTHIDEGKFRVYDLKTALRDLTNVPLERQKILGLVKGKLPEDQVLM
jgi:hypothetical protein